MEVSIKEDICDEAMRIMQAAEEEQLVLRLLGGLAIRTRCPSAEKIPSLKRSYKDIDFATTVGANSEISQLFSKLGYVADDTVNCLNWGERSMFYDKINNRQVDIFVGKFSMCHQIPLDEYCLSTNEYTICLADLFLTKAQIIHLNDKDVRDMLVLLLDHTVSDKGDTEGIDIGRIVKITSDDWGFYHTVAINLEKIKIMLPQYSLSKGENDVITQRIDYLLGAMDKSKKSLAWKIRSKVGERVKWYVIPEEVC